MTSFAGVPKYYAALYDPSGTAFNDEATAKPVELVVGQTGSSQRLATVTPPSGQSFVGRDRPRPTTARSSSRPSRSRSGQVRIHCPAVAWYLLRIAPGHGQGATVTKLPVPGEPSGSQVDGVAVSPDGTRLAIMFQPDVWSGNPNQGA